MKLNCFSSLLAVLMLFTTACSGTRLPVYASNQVYTQPIRLNPIKTYEIELKNRKDPIQVTGNRFVLTPQHLEIRDSKLGQVTQTYPRQNVTAIYQINYNTRGKNTLIGMGIGGGAGFALGWIPVAAIGLKNCNNSVEPGDCKIMKNIGWAMLPISTVIGAGIGAGIGALMKAEKKEEVPASSR